MADTKKKSTNKKKTVANSTAKGTKANVKKDSAKKTNAVKVANSKATQTKASPKKKAVNNQNKKPQDNKAQKKSNTVSKKETEKKEKTMKRITIVLAILFVILLLFTIFSQLGSDENPDYEIKLNTSEMMGDDDQITLTIVEDPDCEHCQVDVFAQQIKGSLIPNLTIKKVSFDSIEGENLLEQVDSNFVPVFIFSKRIETLENWTSLISQAFDEVQIDDQTTYILKDDLVQSKVIVDDFELVENVVSLGNEDSKVTIVEFSDYGCPLCGLAHGNEELYQQFKEKIPQGYVPPIPEIMKNYVDTGKVEYVFMNVPNNAVNSQIRSVHLAGLCANEQDMYEEFSKNIFQNRSVWGLSSNYTQSMKELADDLGLNQDQFDECLDSKKYDSQIDKEIALFNLLEFEEVPVYLVNDNLIVGPQDYRVFEFLIEKELIEEN